MPYKPGGNKTTVSFSIKKANAEKVRKLAEQGYRTKSQMLDLIIEQYKQEQPIKKED